MLSNLKTTDVRSRIEPEIKNRAASVLADCGLTLDDAIRLFLRQVVAQRGLPFDIKTPNAETADAMREARAIGTARFAGAQELLMTSKKPAPQKRAKLPRRNNRTSRFAKDWERLSHSGRYDMRHLDSPLWVD